MLNLQAAILFGGIAFLSLVLFGIFATLGEALLRIYERHTGRTFQQRLRTWEDPE